TGRPGSPIRLTNADPIRGLAYGSTDQMLAVAAGPTIRLVDPDTGNESKQISGFAESVFSLAFSPDGSLLAAGDRAQVRGRSTQLAAEPPLGARPIHGPRLEGGSNETKSTYGASSHNLEPDRGPWVVAVGTGILIILLGTIVLVCRRG